eukprot:6185382-Pleurochrysis_carterae.AAC.2
MTDVLRTAYSRRDSGFRCARFSARAAVLCGRSTLWLPASSRPASASRAMSAGVALGAREVVLSLRCSRLDSTGLCGQRAAGCDAEQPLVTAFYSLIARLLGSCSI